MATDSTALRRAEAALQEAYTWGDAYEIAEASAALRELQSEAQSEAEAALQDAFTSGDAYEIAEASAALREVQSEVQSEAPSAPEPSPFAVAMPSAPSASIAPALRRAEAALQDALTWGDAYEIAEASAALREVQSEAQSAASYTPPPEPSPFAVARPSAPAAHSAPEPSPFAVARPSAPSASVAPEPGPLGVMRGSPAAVSPFTSAPSAGPNTLAKIRADLISWGGAQDIVGQIDAGAPLGTVLSTLETRRKSTTNSKNTGKLDPILAYARTAASAPEAAFAVSGAPEVTEAQALARIRGDLSTWGGAPDLIKNIDAGASLATVRDALVSRRMTTTNPKNVKSLDPIWSYADGVLRQDNAEQGLPPPKPLPKFPEGSNTWTALEDVALPALGAILAPLTFGVANPWSIAAVKALGAGLGSLGSSALQGRPVDQSDALTRAAISAAAAGAASGAGSYLSSAFPETSAAISNSLTRAEDLVATQLGAEGGSGFAGLFAPAVTDAMRDAASLAATGDLLTPTLSGIEQVLVQGALPRAASAGLGAVTAGLGAAGSALAPGMFNPPAPPPALPVTAQSLQDASPKKTVEITGKLAKSTPYTVAPLAPIAAALPATAPSSFAVKPEGPPEGPAETVRIIGERPKLPTIPLPSFSPPSVMPSDIGPLSPVADPLEMPTETVTIEADKPKPGLPTIPLPSFSPPPVLPSDIGPLSPVDVTADDKKLLTWSNLQTALRLAGLASGLGGLLGGGAGGAGSRSAGTVPSGAGERPASFSTDTLPPTTRERSTPRDMGDIDWARYGFAPEKSFFTGVPVRAAHGGSQHRSRADFAVRGAGDGRSDDIPAILSDGEYVIDAETVALLGNGSNKAGAAQLDRFRANVRKHKGKELAKGRFSVKAKAPQAYMGGGRS
jgi:hypothetical protein